MPRGTVLEQVIACVLTAGALASCGADDSSASNETVEAPAETAPSSTMVPRTTLEVPAPTTVESVPSSTVTLSATPVAAELNPEDALCALTPTGQTALPMPADDLVGPHFASSEYGFPLGAVVGGRVVVGMALDAASSLASETRAFHTAPCELRAMTVHRDQLFVHTCVAEGADCQILRVDPDTLAIERVLATDAYNEPVAGGGFLALHAGDTITVFDLDLQPVWERSTVGFLRLVSDNYVWALDQTTYLRYDLASGEERPHEVDPLSLVATDGVNLVGSFTDGLELVFDEELESRPVRAGGVTLLPTGEVFAQELRQPEAPPEEWSYGAGEIVILALDGFGDAAGEVVASHEAPEPSRGSGIAFAPLGGVLDGRLVYSVPGEVRSAPLP